MNTRTGTKSYVLLPVLVAMTVLAQTQMHRLYRPNFPPLNQLIRSEHMFQDAAFVAMGFRRMGADVAWVQLLQSMSEADQRFLNRSYPHLKDDTLRVTRIDPYFHKAYLFGAATLAWIRTINRPAEALEVLQEGVAYNPHYWQFRMYVAGIGYSVSNQFDKMVHMLEDAVSQPDCPTTVKSVLANAYKQQRRYAEAINIWNIILANPKSRDYHDRARHEIPVLEDLLQQQQALHSAPTKQ